MKLGTYRSRLRDRSWMNLLVSPKVKQLKFYSGQSADCPVCILRFIMAGFEPQWAAMGSFFIVWSFWNSLHASNFFGRWVWQTYTHPLCIDFLGKLNVKACICFFLARFLIDRCQIVTDICTKNVRNSVWKSVKSPFSLHKQKYFGEAIL